MHKEPQLKEIDVGKYDVLLVAGKRSRYEITDIVMGVTLPTKVYVKPEKEQELHERIGRYCSEGILDIDSSENDLGKQPSLELTVEEGERQVTDILPNPAVVRLARDLDGMKIKVIYDPQFVYRDGEVVPFPIEGFHEYGTLAGTKEARLFLPHSYEEILVVYDPKTGIVGVKQDDLSQEGRQRTQALIDSQQRLKE